MYVVANAKVWSAVGGCGGQSWGQIILNFTSDPKIFPGPRVSSTPICPLAAKYPMVVYNCLCHVYFMQVVCPFWVFYNYKLCKNGPPLHHHHVLVMCGYFQQLWRFHEGATQIMSVLWMRGESKIAKWARDIRGNNSNALFVIPVVACGSDHNRVWGKGHQARWKPVSLPVPT